MKTQYRITEDDYVKAMKLFGRLTPRQIAIYGAVIVALVLCAMYGSPFFKAGAIGGLAGGLVVVLVGRLVISPILVRRHYRNYKDIRDLLSVELLDEGIKFSALSSEGKLAWDQILKWRQNENYVLIYPTSRLYHIVPKSVANEGFDISVLISQLTKHVGNET